MLNQLKPILKKRKRPKLKANISYIYFFNIKIRIYVFFLTMYWGSKRKDALPVILVLSLYLKSPLLFYALWCWGWNSTNYISHFQLLPVKIFLHCLHGTRRLEGRRRPRTCSLSVYESVTQQQHRFQVAASKNQTHGTPLRGTRSSQTASLPLSPSFLHRAHLQVILSDS